jgi:hypothetical protein
MVPPENREKRQKQDEEQPWVPGIFLSGCFLSNSLVIRQIRRLRASGKAFDAKLDMFAARSST